MIKKILYTLSISAHLIIGSATLSIIGGSSVVYAAPDTSNCEYATTSFLGLPTWYKYLVAQYDETGRCAPVLSGDDAGTKVNSALPIGLAILEGMLRISGLVAVVMIFWSAFKFITTQGAPDAAAGARKTAINAMIGLAIVILATTLVSFAGNSLLP